MYVHCTMYINMKQNLPNDDIHSGTFCIKYYTVLSLDIIIKNHHH